MRDTINMAREAGIDAVQQWNSDTPAIELLKAFEALVRADEREACAKVCEDNATDLSEGDWDSACINCADHIRDRNQS